MTAAASQLLHGQLETLRALLATMRAGDVEGYRARSVEYFQNLERMTELGRRIQSTCGFNVVAPPPAGRLEPSVIQRTIREQYGVFRDC